MSAPQVIDSFLDLLKKSELLSDERVLVATDRCRQANVASPLDAAALLVSDGLLTRFQAWQLLDGRFRGFYFGPYKVLELLGAGGMGCLYVAEEAETGRRVVLKVLTENHQSDTSMVARLKLEAQAGARLQHPNIVKTFAFQRIDDLYGDLHFVVMEFIEGISLEELIVANGPVPWPQACDFIRQAAAGLHHAHAAGVIHRDIKPANLLVTREGDVKILDFGLALLDSHEQEDADEFSLAMIFGHDCLGTADYIAPEQSYDSLAVDGRADIYSLGCTLYSMLTGKVPFPVASGSQVETSSEKLAGHRTRSMQPVREIAPDTPEQVAALIDHMTAKIAGDRFATAADVCRAFEPLAEHRPVNFNYQAILAARAKQARRRLSSRRRPAGQSGASRSSVTGSSRQPTAGSSATARSRAGETRIHSDTEREDSRFSRPAVARVDPLVALRSDAELPSVRLEPPPGQPGDTPPSDSASLPRLVPLAGGPPIVISGNRLLIGRDATCDAVIEAAHVSSRHCEICRVGGRWRIVDLASKNGMQVNGREAGVAWLRTGSCVTIAREFHFRFEEQAEHWFRTRWFKIGLAVAASAALYAAVQWLA